MESLHKKYMQRFDKNILKRINKDFLQAFVIGSFLN